jgi:hypothetical protein
MAILQYNPTGYSDVQLSTEHTKLKTYLDQQNARQIGLISVYIQQHSGVSNAAPPELPCKHIWGDTHLHETLLGVRFRISPKSFFQINTQATEVLYTYIRELIERYQPLDRSLTVLGTLHSSFCCSFLFFYNRTLQRSELTSFELFGTLQYFR